MSDSFSTRVSALFRAGRLLTGAISAKALLCGTVGVLAGVAPAGAESGELAVLAGGHVVVDRDATVTGDLHANGDVTLERDSRVEGDLTWSGSLLRDRGTVTGTSAPAPVHPLPAIPTEAEARAAADRIFEQSTDFHSATIDDVVFVAGTARLLGTIEGTGTLIATAIVVEPEEITTNPPGGPTFQLSLVAFQSIDIAPAGPFTRQFRGPLLAGGDLVIGPGSVLYGSIVAHGNVTLAQAARVQFESFDDTPPILTDLSPIDGAILPSGAVEIGASWSDAGSGIDPTSAVLLIDGTDRTTEASVTATGITLAPATPWGDGSHAIELTVSDFAGNVATASWTFLVDSVPPVLSFTAPAEPVIYDDIAPPIGLTWSDVGTGIDALSLNVLLDGNDLTPQCSVLASEATCFPPVLADGTYSATASVQDRAGHTASATLTFEIHQALSGPDIAITSPIEGEYSRSSEVQVVGTVTDDVGVARVTVNGQAAALAGDQFMATVTLADGFSVVQAEAEDLTGKQGFTAVVVRVDTVPPAIAIDLPGPGAVTNIARARIEGSVEDASPIVSVTAAGQPLTLLGSRFSGEVTLAPGANSVVVDAIDAAGNGAQSLVAIDYFQLPTIEITQPADLATLTATTARVEGVVDDPQASVDVNGVIAAVAPDGTFFADGIPLIEGGNVLAASARSASGAVSTASVHVVRDLTAPNVYISSPSDGVVVTVDRVAVSGLVNDIVAGTVNELEATVTVNGIPATVRNRNFLAADVPLALGENVITATATDESGNVGQATARITRDAPGSEARIEVVSGDLQEAVARTELPQPLVVRVVSESGTPLAGRTVVFEETAGGGKLEGGVRRLAATTDSDGLAQARWTLGRRAGIQHVRASAVGVPRPVELTALAGPRGAAVLVVDAGDQQTGTAGQRLPRPFIATVTDDGFNRLGGVGVEFTVVKGDGHFENGQPTRIVTTDSDGRAVATLTLDPEEGEANNAVAARIAGLPDGPVASFTASGLAAGPAEATAIEGVVLDNTSRPISGVTVRVDDTSLWTTTDEAGQFHIEPAPVGDLLLIVDGSTTERPGVWASLEFRMTTVAGRVNDLGMPIFLLPLAVANGLYVDEVTGGTVTTPSVPGLTLEVAPGSVTFPGGSKSGVVSITTVHSDRVPMTPNFGQQPRLIVTIQPAGARFDPPAKITYPNVEGLAPGESTDLYSFDHDLGHFVSIGPGTVSDDGTMLVSDPGVGILKAGWHCGGDPQSATGTPHNCSECQRCIGTACVPDDGRPCDDQDGCTVNDQCANGTCAGDPVEIMGPEALANGKVKVTIPVQETVNFTVTVQSTNCPASDLKATWTFPDGSTLMGTMVQKAFLQPGYNTVRVEVMCGSCPKSEVDTVEVVSVRLTGLTVLANASKNHVVVPDNWVALKNASNMVPIQAKLDPAVPLTEPLIMWSGGDPVPGSFDFRTVNTQSSRKETVEATLGPDTYSVDIWVMWATISLHGSGSMSSTNGIKTPLPVAGLIFPRLGALTDETNYNDGFTIAETSAHVELAAEIEPQGIDQILDPGDSGWRFKQWLTAGGCINGITANPTNNMPDDPETQYQDVTMESDRMIYYLDAPTLGAGFSFSHTTERYRLFQVQAHWDGKKGSDNFLWSYHAQVDDDLDPSGKPRNVDTVLNQISTGMLPFPSACFFATRP